MRTTAPIIHYIVPRRTLHLDTWVRGKSLPLKLVQRARSVWMAADGMQSQDIARSLGVSKPTAQLWRQRFLAFRLIGLQKDAPRPVLIHCKTGADRSGLAAAMWKVVVDKEPKSEAAKELSFWYGHIPIGKTIAMDQFLKNWNPGRFNEP